MQCKNAFRTTLQKRDQERGIAICIRFFGEGDPEAMRSMNHEAVLILSDINMPGMTGPDLLNIIKKTYLQPPPVVMLITAYGDDENRKTAKDLAPR